jgi:hypothetical protein
MPRDICTLICVSFLPYDDLDPVYFTLLWVFVGGKMLEVERMEFEFMQARLIESESKMHHYETLVRSREQELTKTKRVSTLTCIGSNVSRILCVCVRACVWIHICANLLQYGRHHFVNCLGVALSPPLLSRYRLQLHLVSDFYMEAAPGLISDDFGSCIILCLI